MNCIFCNQELKLIDKYSIIYRCDNCIYDINLFGYKRYDFYYDKMLNLSFGSYKYLVSVVYLDNKYRLGFSIVIDDNKMKYITSYIIDNMPSLLEIENALKRVLNLNLFY